MHCGPVSTARRGPRAPPRALSAQRRSAAQLAPHPPSRQQPLENSFIVGDHVKKKPNKQKTKKKIIVAQSHAGSP